MAAAGEGEGGGRRVWTGIFTRLGQKKKKHWTEAMKTPGASC